MDEIGEEGKEAEWNAEGQEEGEKRGMDLSKASDPNGTMPFNTI